MVRAFFRAVKVETAVSPHDTITLKIYYPAAPTGDEVERMTGVVAADVAQAPFPVVILMPGINVGPEAYHWLAVALAEKGLVVVTYIWVAEEMPGYISVTPGVDIDAVRPDNYGIKPTCPALTPILAKLATLHETDHTPLKGLLDLDKMILGGHSAGGTMALQSVHAEWFPQVKGAFTYGAHLMASTFLGYEAGTVLPMLGKRPLMLIGGNRDGVIEASTRRYGIDAGPTTALERTFAESVTGGDNDSYLVILEGANHFSLVHPIDETTGRPFLDHPTTQPDDQIRGEIVTLVSFFIDAHIRGNPRAKIGLKQQLSSGNPLIAKSRIK